MFYIKIIVTHVIVKNNKILLTLTQGIELNLILIYKFNLDFITHAIFD